MMTNASKPSFLSWCLWTVGPAFLVWLGFSYLFLDESISGAILLRYGLAWVAGTYGCCYLLRVMIAEGWPVGWWFWVVATAIIFAALTVKLTSIFGMTVLSAPGYVAVAILGETLTPKFVETIGTMGFNDENPKIVALLIYGAPPAGFICGGLAAGLLGYGEKLVRFGERAALEELMKAHVIGGMFAGFFVGLLFTAFALAGLGSQAKVGIAAIWIVVAFLPHLRLTWKNFSYSKELLPVERPEPVRFARIIFLILCGAFVFSVVFE